MVPHADFGNNTFRVGPPVLQHAHAVLFRKGSGAVFQRRFRRSPGCGPVRSAIRIGTGHLLPWRPCQVPGQLELQCTRCIRSSIRRPVCIDTLRAENGNLHLPDPYPGPWIYIRTIVSTILLVHGEAKHGQYRAHRTFLGRSLRDTVPDYL